jgi:hypothetical protein
MLHFHNVSKQAGDTILGHSFLYNLHVRHKRVIIEQERAQITVPPQKRLKIQIISYHCQQVPRSLWNFC